MSTVATPVQTFAGAQRVPTVRPRTHAGLFQCLVVSESDRRCAMFERAAAESGWDAVVYQDPERALAQTRRIRFQLVIVDLDGSYDSAPPGFRELAEHLARTGGPLLMVCGSEEDPLEEIWARQLGAWLYLPGVDESCDIAMLCSEAQQAVTKLRPRQTDEYETYARSA